MHGNSFERKLASLKGKEPVTNVSHTQLKEDNCERLGNVNVLIPVIIY